MATKNRQTGTEITITKNDGFVTLCCEDHGAICEFASLNQAKPFKASPADWCEECAAQVYGKKAA